MNTRSLRNWLARSHILNAHKYQLSCAKSWSPSAISTRHKPFHISYFFMVTALSFYSVVDPGYFYRSKRLRIPNCGCVYRSFLTDVSTCSHTEHLSHLNPNSIPFHVASFVLPECQLPKIPSQLHKLIKIVTFNIARRRKINLIWILKKFSSYRAVKTFLLRYTNKQHFFLRSTHNIHNAWPERDISACFSKVVHTATTELDKVNVYPMRMSVSAHKNAATPSITKNTCYETCYVRLHLTL
jgi:hypothetical protein